MNTQVTVDLNSAIPPFEQVRGQLESLITSGSLLPGSRLPTVRDLATDLGIAVGTVARAYRELETIGLVTSRRRTGTVVAQGVQKTPASVQLAIDSLVREVRAEGMSDDAAVALVRGALLADG